MHIMFNLLMRQVHSHVGAEEVKARDVTGN